MKDFQGETIINSLLEDMNITKRRTKGRDTTKKYNKITISVDLEDKLKIEEYAKKNNISVSALIRNLLKENSIL